MIPHITYAVSAFTVPLLLCCSHWAFLSCWSSLWSLCLSTVTFGTLLHLELGFFFPLQCLYYSQGRQFFHLCHPVSSPLEKAVSVLTPTKSFEGTSSNNDLPCPAVGPISFPDTWMLFFFLYADFIHRIFLSSSTDWFNWCPPPNTLTVQPASLKSTFPQFHWHKLVKCLWKGHSNYYLMTPEAC